MHIVIIILSIIDTALIYGVSLKLGDFIPEILFDVLGALIFVFVGIHIAEDNEPFLPFFRKMIFVSLIVVLIGILFSIYKKHLTGIQTNFSIIIPLYITYFVLTIKDKRGDL